MRENEIERQLAVAAKKMGGMAVKFVSPGLDGVPDRIVLLSGRKIAFVELKAPGKKPRALQEKRKRQLEALGFLLLHNHPSYGWPVHRNAAFAK